MLGALAIGAVQALGVAGQYASGVMSARARRAEFDQQIRAVELRKAQTLAMTRARAAAAGGMENVGSLSTLDYLAGLADEFNAETNYLRTAKRLTSKANNLSNTFGLVGGGAQVFGNYAAMNNFWR